MTSTLLADALRQVARSRRYALPAALCAALGLAAFGAVGALLDAALVAPLPFRDAARLVRVWMAEPPGDALADLSVPEAESILARVGSFESVAASARVRVIARFDDGTERLRGEAVSRDYFSTLGLRPAIGRTFRADEAEAPVVLVGHRLWRERLGGDPNVVGRNLATGQGDLTVVGVMPAWFHGAIEADEVELWLPFAFAGTPAQRADRTRRHVWIAARLAPASSADAASAEIDTLSAALHAEDPRLRPAQRLVVEPFAANWRAPVRRTGGLLGAAATALLVVALANAAGLLAVRARARRHELALRGALGASPARLARQLLVESLLVIGAGGLAGLAAAWPLLDLFLAANPSLLPPYVEVAPNPWTLALGLALALAAGAVAGSLPAREALGARPIDALRAGSRAALGERRRVAGALVACQLAATLVLLAGATLVLRSYASLAGAPMGFETERLYRTAVTPAREDLAGVTRAAVVERLRARLEAVPGVEAVGFVSPTLPPWDGWRPRLEGVPGGPDGGLPVGGHAVDAALFDALGVPLVAGRTATAGESADGARVAVLSRSLAARLAGEPASPAAALGRAVRFAPGDDVEGELTVIGVVEDLRWGGHVDQESQSLFASGAARFDLYLPLGLVPHGALSIAVRTAGAPASHERALRAAIAQAAPHSPIHWTSTMGDELGLEIRSARFVTLVVDAFATAALAIAGAGLFGYLSTLVLSRRRELGLRGALGASRAALARLVAREAARLLLPAAGAAAVGVASIQPLLHSVLHEVAPHDPTALAGAFAALLLAAGAALAPPLRAVLRLDPAVALRDE